MVGNGGSGFCFREQLLLPGLLALQILVCAIPQKDDVVIVQRVPGMPLLVHCRFHLSAPAQMCRAYALVPGERVEHRLTGDCHPELSGWAAQVFEVFVVFHVKGGSPQHCCRDLRRADPVPRVVFDYQHYEPIYPRRSVVVDDPHRRNSRRQLRPCLLLALLRKELYLYDNIPVSAPLRLVIR